MVVEDVVGKGWLMDSAIISLYQIDIYQGADHVDGYNHICKLASGANNTMIQLANSKKNKWPSRYRYIMYAKDFGIA
jgi:hypothetical protein